MTLQCSAFPDTLLFLQLLMLVPHIWHNSKLKVFLKIKSCNRTGVSNFCLNCKLFEETSFLIFGFSFFVLRVLIMSILSLPKKPCRVLITCWFWSFHWNNCLCCCRAWSASKLSVVSAKVHGCLQPPLDGEVQFPWAESHLIGNFLTLAAFRFPKLRCMSWENLFHLHRFSACFKKVLGLRKQCITAVIGSASFREFPGLKLRTDVNHMPWTCKSELHSKLHNYSYTGKQNRKLYHLILHLVKF